MALSSFKSRGVAQEARTDERHGRRFIEDKTPAPLAAAAAVPAAPRCWPWPRDHCRCWKHVDVALRRDSEGVRVATTHTTVPPAPSHSRRCWRINPYLSVDEDRASVWRCEITRAAPTEAGDAVGQRTAALRLPAQDLLCCVSVRRALPASSIDPPPPQPLPPSFHLASERAHSFFGYNGGGGQALARTASAAPTTHRPTEGCLLGRELRPNLGTCDHEGNLLMNTESRGEF